MHADGDVDTWRDAYGKVLGTVLVASFLEIGLSFVPPKILRRTFPPIVTGTAVFLIGAALVGTGVRYDFHLFIEDSHGFSQPVYDLHHGVNSAVAAGGGGAGGSGLQWGGAGGRGKGSCDHASPAWRR